MSQHRSLRAATASGAKRNVLKRFERVLLLKKRGQWKEGDRVTADINTGCGNCFYCHKGNLLVCPDFHQLGIHVNGTGHGICTCGTGDEFAAQAKAGGR